MTDLENATREELLKTLLERHEMPSYREAYLDRAPTDELINALTKREGVEEFQIAPNEEGVINKYVPSGYMGMGKSPVNLRWGIYGHARILVVVSND